MIPSFSVRDTRRFPGSQAMRRPCRSSVRPFAPICTPSGNSRGKTGLRKIESSPAGVHFIIALDGISLNSRYPLLRSQTGPSANRRLPITFSTAAPAGTSLSNAGSRRRTLPTLPDWAASGRIALAHDSTERSLRCCTELCYHWLTRAGSTCKCQGPSPPNLYWSRRSPNRDPYRNPLSK